MRLSQFDTKINKTPHERFCDYYTNKNAKSIQRRILTVRTNTTPAVTRYSNYEVLQQIKAMC